MDQWCHHYKIHNKLPISVDLLASHQRRADFAIFICRFLICWHSRRDENGLRQIIWFVDQIRCPVFASNIEIQCPIGATVRPTPKIRNEVDPIAPCKQIIRIFRGKWAAAATAPNFSINCQSLQIHWILDNDLRVFRFTIAAIMFFWHNRQDRNAPCPKYWFSGKIRCPIPNLQVVVYGRLPSILALVGGKIEIFVLNSHHPGAFNAELLRLTATQCCWIKIRDIYEAFSKTNEPTMPPLAHKQQTVNLVNALPFRQRHVGIPILRCGNFLII